jgi:hypothetical protein
LRRPVVGIDGKADMSDCEHKYVYQGLQYAHGHHNRPGSGAKQRHYAHVFFCEKCLEKRADRVDYGDDCSYFDVKDGATRGDVQLIVPEWDRRKKVRMTANQ